MFIRKLGLVAALLVVGLVPATPALAAQAPAASAASAASAVTEASASSAAPAGFAAATTWYIEGYYDQLTCLDRGSFGQSSGWWISYYCEPDYGGDINRYRLWVEVQGSSTGPCSTAGHVYLVNGSTLYFSGYEGDYRNGIATTSVPAGYAVIALGATGSSPRPHPSSSSS
ncbi:hypothetical protein Psuf_084060 [Phytohabitans suffuscus]|uniref:Secreted protein n=1 Tax=Phytohabitans suffuscus TaxID=624315 RepID=A0A6F8YYL8_9ACTN|nr:hypothetical protein [Phytohabitans suffuscus]BCB91093.1 hypothetical protein Psuf_084060 [Phytohabitans suffuscus]